MTLFELLNELQRMRSRVNDQIEVEVCIYEDREDFYYEKIETIEENENQNGQRIIGISLKKRYWE
jgi:hypothetical protein